MELLTTLLIGLLLVGLFFLFRSGSHSKKSSLPSPPGLSIIKVLYYTLRYRRDYVRMEIFNTYGEIFRSSLAGSPFICINSHKGVHEAFVGQAETFSGRPHFPFFDYVTHKSGILFQDGPLWQEHRRHTLRLLRDFGVGRSGAEEIVTEEWAAIKERLEAAGSQGVDCRRLFIEGVNNVIARLIFGERCGSDDPKFQRFVENIDATIHLKLLDMIPLIVPIIVKIPPLWWCFNKISSLCHVFDEIHDYIRQKIRAHEEQLKEEDMENFEASNVCDAYIVERNKQEAANPGKHTYTDWQLIRNMFELFIAGTETTATTLTWAILLLSLHPSAQKKVQKEIFDEIGREREPQMADRSRLPYLCAIMDEVLRYSSLVPANVQHRTLTDTELLGYFIPADTMVVTNLHCIHHDPQLWKRPKDFYPEHFLAPDGTYKPSKYLIPFSIGKRACLGESLARMELFIALTSVMQHFEVRLEDPSADVEAIMRGEVGAVRHPLHHNIVFTKLDEV